MLEDHAADRSGLSSGKVGMTRREQLGGLATAVGAFALLARSDPASAQRPRVSVAAKRLPGATDDNAAFAAAIAEAKQIGGTVYFPQNGGSQGGTYLIGCQAYNDNNTQGAGNVPSDIEIHGDGKYKTFIRWLPQNPGTFYGNSYLFFAHADGSGNKHDIIIRDMSLLGNSDVRDASGQLPQLSQATHLVALAGTSRVLVENVEFRASQGDGVFLGDPFNGGLHNDSITIRSCNFDGVNNNNRNAISILDAASWTIETCAFVRWGASSQPGAIDLEPELDPATKNTPNPRSPCIIKDGTIQNCYFERIGQSALSCFLLPQEYFRDAAGNAQPVQRVLFKNCSVYDCQRAFYFVGYRGAIPANALSYDVRVEGLYCERMNAPFSISGALGVTLYANTFKESDRSFLSEAGPNRNVTIEGCSFVHCGKTNGSTILQSGDVQNVRVSYNRAFDCGRIGAPSCSFYQADSGRIEQLVITHNHVECTENPPKTTDVARRAGDPYPGLISVLVACNEKVNLATYGIDNLETTGYAGCPSCSNAAAPCN